MDQRQRRAERDRQERERRERRRKNEQRESSSENSVDLNKNQAASPPPPPSSSIDLNKTDTTPDFVEQEESSIDLNKVREPGEPTQNQKDKRELHSSLSIAERISGNRSKRVDGAAFIFVVAIVGMFYFLNRVTETNEGDGTTQSFDSPISYDPSNLKATDWKGTTAVATDGRYLFTTNSKGALHRTNMKTGEMEKLGSNEFEKTNMMFSEMGYIFLFQNMSDYYMVSPVGGSAKQSLMNAVDHRRTIAGTVINDTIFSIEKNGQLYATHLHSGESKAIGPPDYKGSKYLFDYADVLYNVESDGNLYRINRNTGEWNFVDDKQKFKGVLALTVFHSNVYFVTNSGSLKKYDLNAGSTQLIGAPAYSDAKFLTTIDGTLYLITKQGNLLAIRI